MTFKFEKSVENTNIIYSKIKKWKNIIEYLNLNCVYVHLKRKMKKRNKIWKNVIKKDFALFH